MIIGISGKIGSGKDTTGRIIQYLTLDEQVFSKTNKDIIADLEHNGYCANKSNWQVKKFAGKLKEIVALLTGCKVEDLESQDFKNSYLGKEWEYYNNGIPLKPMAITSDALEALGEDRIHCYNYRTLLQKIGTDAMRDIIHENIWVNALFADYKDITLQDKIDYFKSKGVNDFDFLKKTNIKLYKQIKEDFFKITRPLTSNWIITDTRFPNELKAIKDRGGISIRVEREGFIKTTIDGINYKTEAFDKNNLSHVGFKLHYELHQHPAEAALDNAEFDYIIDNNGTIEELIEKVKEILIKEKII